TSDKPVLASPFAGADVGTVDACSGPVEFAGRVQLGEQDAVQPVEDSGPLPALEAPPVSLARAEPRCQAMSLRNAYRMPRRHRQSAPGAGPEPAQAMAAGAARSTPTSH